MTQPTDRPSCFGSNPSAQAQAENDCRRCPHRHLCFDVSAAMSMEEVTKFLIPHGTRNAHRVAEEIAKAAVEVLVKHGIKGFTVKPFSATGFDVKNPDSQFSHIEFNITCTGWERDLCHQKDSV